MCHGARLERCSTVRARIASAEVMARDFARNQRARATCTLGCTTQPPHPARHSVSEAQHLRVATVAGACTLDGVQQLVRDTRPIRRATTVVIAATCLSLQLFATFHLLTVKHELCAEHGEAIDVERSARPDHLRLDSGHSAETGPAASSGTRSENGTHDHCMLAADRSSGALLVSAANGSAHFAPFIAKGPRSADLWSMPASVLRLLAPKTSPPA